ncbi:hypothetical protein GY45DRAFT_476078 [Cubamyces sp. BRFM 1775]|nr:hypothetical protein GY45DRAFT_476078 [Cubamyces sp. BRFM 1775]
MQSPLHRDEETVQELRAQITSHARAALSLKHSLNACAPISKLPPHLLALIFIHQAATIQNDNLLNLETGSYWEPERVAHKPVYSWLNVARVSQQWRDVALGCPELWAFATVDQRVPPLVLEKCEERSQGLPLRAVVHEVYQGSHCARCMSDDADSANRAAGFEMLRRVLHRTTHLSLFLDDRDDCDLWSVVEHEAGQLKSLRIVSARYIMKPHKTGNNASSTCLTSVPTNLFGLHTPVLVYLLLEGVEFVLDNTLLCPSLKHLNITNCRMLSSINGSADADVSDFITALRGMPRLETVKLSRSALQVQDLAKAQHEPVELPHVQLLRVPMGGELGTALLCCLHIPATATRHFTAQSTGLRERCPEAPAGLLHLLAGTPVWAILCGARRPTAFFGSDEDPPPFQLWVQDELADGPASDIGGQTWAAATSLCPPRFVIECDTSPSLLTSLDLRPLRFFTIRSGYVQRRDRPWMNVLESVPSVTTLRIVGELAFGLGAILTRWVHPRDTDAAAGVGKDPDDYLGYSTASGALEEKGYIGGATSPLPFPNLRRIEIACIDFPLDADAEAGGRKLYFRYTGQYMLWFPGPNRGAYGFDMPGFVKGLRARVERGAAPVERVDFEQCQCAKPERLRTLLEVVPEVWWDGRRLTLDDLRGQEPWLLQELEWPQERPRGRGCQEPDSDDEYWF